MPQSDSRVADEAFRTTLTVFYVSIIRSTEGFRVRNFVRQF